ncbi:Major facilitator superfamily domain-containing protein [Drosera capensis]
MFAAIFNLGWAATQVSHMSMVNCMTLNSTSRVVLASCRNAFTMVANLSLYAIAFTLFNLTTPRTHDDIENQVEEGHSSRRDCKNPVYWFKKALYYQVALIYVLTRLVTNVSQAFLAFYVINDLQMAQSSKALIPAIIFTCRFVVSVLLQETTWTSDRIKMVYSTGCALWIVCGGGFLLLPQSLHVFMYRLSVLAGVANALKTVTGISMQSYLVGEDLNGNAFVYGSLSFMDKISCGLVLYLLESYQNSSQNLQLPYSPTIRLSISRLGVGLVPALCAFIGVVVTYTLKFRAPAWKPLMEPLLS